MKRSTSTRLASLAAVGALVALLSSVAGGTPPAPPAKDLPKQPAKDAPKAPPKDAPNESPKEAPKQAPKESPADAPKKAPDTAPKEPAPPTAPSTPGQTPSPEWQTAPKVTGPTTSIHDIVLKDLDGKDISLSKYAGKPMVIEVWATWCGPCKKQRDLMNKLAPEFKDKVVFIGASVDQGGAAVVKEHLKKSPVCAELFDCMSTPALSGAIATRDRSGTIPKVVYVDSKGKIIDVSASAQNEKWMRAMLKALR